MKLFIYSLLVLLFVACGGTAQEPHDNNLPKNGQIAKSPTEEQFGIILVKTPLYSQPSETAQILETLNPETNVYAVAYDLDAVWSDWAVVKTKNEKLGFVPSERIGLYTATNRIGQVSLDNEKIDVYLANSVGGGSNIITPVARLTNGKTLLLNSFDNYNLDVVDRDAPSTDFIQVAERDGSAEVNWDLSILDNNLQAKYRYSIPETSETGSETMSFKLGFDTKKTLYAVRISNYNSTNDADEQQFEYMVATEKIPVYADDNFTQIKTHLNAWECAKTVKFSARKDNISKIQLNNGEKGYIKYVFEQISIDEDTEINNCTVIFFNKSYNEIDISGKKYNVITPVSMGLETTWDIVLLTDENDGQEMSVKPILRPNAKTKNLFDYFVYESTGSDGTRICATVKDNKLGLYINEWSDGEENVEVHQMFYYELIQTVNGEIQAKELPALRKEISFTTQE